MDESFEAVGNQASKEVFTTNASRRAIEFENFRKIIFFESADVFCRLRGGVGVISLITRKTIFVFKTDAEIDFAARRSGVELDRFNAGSLENFDGMLHQDTRNAAAAKIGMNEHHADPAEVMPVSDRGRGCDGTAFAFGEKTAARAEFYEALPVSRRLVPPGVCAQRIGERDIGGGQIAESEARHPATLTPARPLRCVSIFSSRRGRSIGLVS